MTMIEIWSQSLDAGGHAEALLTDLLIAFDYINHNLLNAKLNGSGFNIASLNFIYSYVNGWKQRKKTNFFYGQVYF